MLKRPAFAVVVTSSLLLMYCVFISIGALHALAFFIFAISPVVLIWLAYTIIRFGTYTGTDLQEDEEWGYEDKNKDELSVL